MQKAIAYLIGLAIVWIIGKQFEKNKIIKCKTCGEEISKDAKRCPYCGAKNSKPLNTILNLIIIIMVISTLWGYLNPKLVVKITPTTQVKTELNETSFK